MSPDTTTDPAGPEKTSTADSEQTSATAAPVVRLVEYGPRLVPEIAGRRFPSAEVTVEGEPGGAYTRRGIHLFLENQWVISIQWGEGAYGSNYNLRLRPNLEFTEEPTSIEMAIWHVTDYEMIKWADLHAGGDEFVHSYLSPTDALRAIDEVNTWSSNPLGPNDKTRRMTLTFGDER